MVPLHPRHKLGRPEGPNIVRAVMASVAEAARAAVEAIATQHRPQERPALTSGQRLRLLQKASLNISALGYKVK